MRFIPSFALAGALAAGLMAVGTDAHASPAGSLPRAPLADVHVGFGVSGGCAPAPVVVAPQTVYYGSPCAPTYYAPTYYAPTYYAPTYYARPYYRPYSYGYSPYSYGYAYPRFSVGLGYSNYGHHHHGGFGRSHGHHHSRRSLAGGRHIGRRR